MRKPKVRLRSPPPTKVMPDKKKELLKKASRNKIVKQGEKYGRND